MRRSVPFAIALIPMLIIGFNALWEFPVERYIYSFLTSPFRVAPYRYIFVIKLALHQLIMLFLIVVSISYFLNPQKKQKETAAYILRSSFIMYTISSIANQLTLIAEWKQNWDDANGFWGLIRLSLMIIISAVLWKGVPQKDIFRINLSDYTLWETPGKWNRFLHHVTDLLFFYAITEFWVVFLQSTMTYLQVTFIISGMVAIYFLYFFLSEAFLGQTPGQSLTNSCPVGLRSPMSVRKVLLRSLGRLIPFDRFSFLWGKNWHDRISGTTVVRRNSWKDIPFEGERQ
ncbi:MAG: RDD family protein [Pseudobacter sp.]|uniref:RDD family protein n=1 Tax=Pseudobacter sp. TaxID=2045420 RepID=UPI003F810BE1